MCSKPPVSGETKTPGLCDAMSNLSSVIDSSRASTLNAARGSSIADLLSGKGGFVKSDKEVDAQLLVVVPFKEKVKIRGIRFGAAQMKEDKESSGPKLVKIFVDAPSMAFADCETSTPVQELSLSARDVASSDEIKLKFVKFQSVGSVTLFFENNLTDADVTFISKLEFIGAPKDGMDMSSLKKSG